MQWISNGNNLVLPGISKGMYLKLNKHVRTQIIMTLGDIWGSICALIFLVLSSFPPFTLNEREPLGFSVKKHGHRRTAMITRVKRYCHVRSAEIEMNSNKTCHSHAVMCVAYKIRCAFHTLTLQIGSADCFI